MKTFIVEVVKHPLSLGMFVLAVAATADITVCTIERYRLNHAIRKNKPYQGSDYQGVFVKQKLAKFTPSKQFAK